MRLPWEGDVCMCVLALDREGSSHPVTWPKIRCTRLLVGGPLRIVAGYYEHVVFQGTFRGGARAFENCRFAVWESLEGAT